MSAEETVMQQSFRFRIDTEVAAPQALPKEFVAEMTKLVNSSKEVNSDETYTNLLSGVSELIKKCASRLTVDTPIYNERLPRIGRHEQTIATDWGGVFFIEASEAKNHVEKYLIVKQAIDPSGVLGFEYHNKKVEKLQVVEGYAILMRADDSGNVLLTFAGPGDTCELNPPTAHGIIPLTNTAILESSNYELDAADLLFIFSPVKSQL